MTVSTRAKWPLAAALLVLAAGCSKQDDHGAQAPAETAPSAAAAPAAAQQAAAKRTAAAQLKTMDAEALRAAAVKALGDNRLYSPAGDNAVEYYLALRAKAPDDAAVASALTDLMPYTVIAVEQSIGRQDFVEARRLQGLVAQADPKAPSLPRLGAAIESGEKAAQAKLASDQAKSKADADNNAKEQQRLAEQAARQKAAADQLAAQQQAAAAEAQRQQAARQDAERAAAQKAA
ncbi:MAG: energy transducer TonB, partial [Pseudoxanthomonas sp.]